MFLLPAKSLSHFNLRQVYSDQSELPTIPSLKNEAERNCELVENISLGTVLPHKPVIVPKDSLTQIRSTHPSISWASLAALVVSDSGSPTIRRTKRSSDLRKCADAQSFAPDTTLTSITEHSPSSAPNPISEDSFQMVRHFASFCIIDIVAPGCPVNAVSEDLRYVYDIKDRFVLNAQECSELSMDLSVGRDPDGNEVTYVLLFSPLVSPATSESHFVLVSAIDVSGYVRYAASLDRISEPKDENLPPSSFRQRSRLARQPYSCARIDEGSEQLADEFHHGCSIKDNLESSSASSHGFSSPSYSKRSKHDSEDIWAAIAREEGLISRKPSARSRSQATPSSPSNPVLSRKQTQPTSSTSSKSSLDYADEEVLGTFIGRLQVLYSEYFLLSCMPFYEICYISPAVYASGEYDTGHLSYTTVNLMNDLGSHLAAGRRFQATIRWGKKNAKKRLYCVPLVGPEPAPWICVLVDMETPIHW
jgi:hypothetical protein